MTAFTSLGRLYGSLGVPDWEEIFPQQICAKCFLQRQCPSDKRCAALTIIGGLAVKATFSAITAQAFAFNLKETLKSVQKI